MTPRAVIFGCEGLDLNDWEKGFFAESDPLGFILFLRNCDNPGQVEKLVQDLRASVGRAQAPVLIDQEGGRVTRLKPPHWRAAPPAEAFGALALLDIGKARRAVQLNTELLAQELGGLGIDVDCLPLLDLRVAGADDVIGSRAFSADAGIVADLGRVQQDTFLACGVTPVIKHLPGHGRASVDSHHELPRVPASRAELTATDFRPFQALADAPWGMTGHLVFEAIDPDNPATTSSSVIAEVIRGEIGFDGLLLSDDIGMNALEGGFGERSSRSLAAGCDVVLHCSGKAEEMKEVAAACGALSEKAMERFSRGLKRRQAWRSASDNQERLDELDSLLAGA